MIELRPINQADAFDFIRKNHRHHDVPVGGLWWQAVHNDAGSLVGVSVSGRPVARGIDDGLTAEVTRLCTDGTANACSMLYAAARRVAQDKGYRRGITYILDSEDGASLRATGWTLLWTVKGRSWSCESRPRVDKHPTCDKRAYGWGAWPHVASTASPTSDSDKS